MFSEMEAQKLLERLYEERTVDIAVDTETTGLHVASGDDYCIGVSIAGLFEDGTPFSGYFPFAHETGDNFGGETHAMLDYILSMDPHLLIFCNAPFDILSLSTINIRLDETDFIDICTMAHLCDENWPKDKKLDTLAKVYLSDGEREADSEEAKVVDAFVEAEKRSGNRNITPEQMSDYAVRDAVLTWRIHDVLLDHRNWKQLLKDAPEYWPHKQELMRVLIEMERRGVRIDQALAAQEIAHGEQEMKRIARELGYPGIPKKATKRNPNPDPDPMPTLGPIALEEIFIQRLGLPVVKASTLTGKPSFDKQVMEEYDLMLERLDSPEAKLVKAYRGWQITVGLAYRPYLEMIDADGRLRCTYKTHGTVTGRLSCSKPNLQQIPKTSDKPWNGKVKRAFIAKPGYTLINADFSQLELRLGTAYAGERELADVFEEGRDIFTEMSEALGLTRQDTKTLVYSMQYGAGLNRIMTVFGVSKARAEEIRNNYFNTYPRFKTLADRCARSAEQNGKVKLWSGRYRHFKYKSEAFKAMNSVIQGGAADVVERIMVRCFRELDNEDCQMLLQVHDSITWEVRTELVDEYMPKIKALMEDVSGAVGHDEFNVRFAVEVEHWVKEAA
jgi:DNA polymerase-1